MINDNGNLKLLGEKIRMLRQEKGLSIIEFADMTGVTSAYISQIERNLIEPSLPVLRSLAEALETEIFFLFTDEMPSDVIVTTEDMRRDISVMDSFVKFQFLMPSYLENGKKPDLAVTVTKLEGKVKDYKEFVVHNNTEFALVLKGCIEYQTNNGVYKLYEGDSIYLQKNVPHNIYNPWEEEAVFLSVVPSIPPHIKLKE